MHCNLSSGTDFPKGNPEFCNFHKNTQKTYHKNCVRKDFGLPDSGSRLFSLNSWVQLFKEAPKTCPNISLLAKYNRNSFSFSLLQEFILHHITGTEVLPSCRKLQIYLNILYQYLPTWIMQLGLLVNKSSTSRTCFMLHRDSPHQRVVPEVHRLVTRPVNS